MGSIQDSYEFFFKQLKDRAEAADLARAETWGVTHNVTFEWQQDGTPPQQQGRGPLAEDSEWLCAHALIAGEVVAAISGIDIKRPSFIQGVAQSPYIRVVNARLAAQAQDKWDLRQAAEAAASNVKLDAVVRAFLRGMSRLGEGRGPRDDRHVTELVGAFSRELDKRLRATAQQESERLLALEAKHRGTT